MSQASNAVEGSQPVYESLVYGDPIDCQRWS